MKQILYDMGNFFLYHNPILWSYNYVISGRYRHKLRTLDPPGSLLWAKSPLLRVCFFEAFP